MEKIDFVILWVDGMDPIWLKEKMAYQTDSQTPDTCIANAVKCFRDWNLLQYWFRGIERFAPWVNKIHFVTYGHLPKWLNTDYSKLNIVNHKDFMPIGSLPTYNSRALELNLHRIKGLANQFVYFNDDTFLIHSVKQEDFFINGQPRDCAILSPIRPQRFGTGTIQMNDMEIINDHFSGIEIMTHHTKKWITMKYGRQLTRTLLFYPLKQMIGFYEPHLAVSYLKETYKKIWSFEEEVLLNTTKSRFKQKDNVNQWLVRYWQLAEGNFSPRNPTFGRYYDLSINLPEICNVIKYGKKHMVCLNDSISITNMEPIQKKLVLAFDTLLPNRSKFEK